MRAVNKAETKSAALMIWTLNKALDDSINGNRELLSTRCVDDVPRLQWTGRLFPLTQ